MIPQEHLVWRKILVGLVGSLLVSTVAEGAVADTIRSSGCKSTADASSVRKCTGVVTNVRGWGTAARAAAISAG